MDMDDLLSFADKYSGEHEGFDEQVERIAFCLLSEVEYERVERVVSNLLFERGYNVLG